MALVYFTSLFATPFFFMFKILHNCTSLVPLNRTCTLMQNLKENCTSIHQTIMAKVNQQTPVHQKGWMVGGQETHFPLCSSSLANHDG